VGHDRDNNWERIEKAYQAIANGVSDEKFENPQAAIKKSYQEKVLDEEFVPTVIVDGDKPVAVVEDNDAVIFANFRADRARQLTKAFVLPDFDKFKRTYLPNLFFVTMMEYEKDLPVEVAFPPEEIQKTLADVIADAGLKQLHIAETEKSPTLLFSSTVWAMLNIKTRIKLLFRHPKPPATTKSRRWARKKSRSGFWEKSKINNYDLF